MTANYVSDRFPGPDPYAVDDVLGRDVEGRHVRQRGVRVGAGETVGIIICSHVPIPTGEVVTAATPRSEQVRVSPVGMGT